MTDVLIKRKTVPEALLQSAKMLNLLADGAKNGELKRAVRIINILERNGILPPDFNSRNKDSQLTEKVQSENPVLTLNEHRIRLAAAALEKIAEEKMAEASSSRPNSIFARGFLGC